MLVVVVDNDDDDDATTDKENARTRNAEDADMINAINSLLGLVSTSGMTNTAAQAAVMRGALRVAVRVERVMRSVDGEVAAGALRLLDDVDVARDVGVRDQLWGMASAYEAEWLALGLTVLTGSAQLPTRAAFERHLGLNGDGDNDDNNDGARFVIRRFLALVLFLDEARRANVLAHKPCLFAPGSATTSSQHTIQAFASLVLAGGGNVLVQLQRLNYAVAFKQLPIHAYALPAVTDLDCDLCDGVVLAALAGNDVLVQMKVPADNRIARLANVARVLRHLATRGAVKGIEAVDVVRGQRAATLRLLDAVLPLCAARIIPVGKLRIELGCARGDAKTLLRAWVGGDVAAAATPATMLALVRRKGGLGAPCVGGNDWAAFGSTVYDALGGVTVRLTQPCAHRGLAECAVASLCARLLRRGGLEDDCAAGVIQAQWRSARVRALLRLGAFAELEVYARVAAREAARRHLADCIAAARTQRRAADCGPLLALVRTVRDCMDACPGATEAAAAMAVELMCAFYDSVAVFALAADVLERCGEPSPVERRRLHALALLLTSLDRAARVCGPLPNDAAIRANMERLHKRRL